MLDSALVPVNLSRRGQPGCDSRWRVEASRVEKKEKVLEARRQW